MPRRSLADSPETLLFRGQLLFFFGFTVPILHVTDHVLPWICLDDMVQNGVLKEASSTLKGVRPELGWS